MKRYKKICVSFLLATIGGMAAPAYAQVTVDGSLSVSEGYGAPLAAQTINTGFGDNTSSGGTSSGGSELDAIYTVATNGYLYLFIAGNLQANGNNINVFIADGQAGGQGVLEIGGSPGEAAMNGSTFSPGFNPNLLLTFTNSATVLSVDRAVLAGGSGTESHLGSVALSGGIGNSQNVGGTGIAVGFNNVNTAGVNGSSGTAASQAAADAVTSGLELGIPLSALGDPAGPVEVLVDINGSSFVYLSNQFLPGLAVGTGNLGAGGGNYGPGGGVFNFGSTSGEYLTVPISGSGGGLPPVLTVNGNNADYGTTHVFINEVSNDAAAMTVIFSPNAPTNVVEADVFSNLNRRDHAAMDANGDGIEDGILPPDGNTIATGDTNNYYEAYAMSPTGTPGQYSLTLYAQKTGVYRLTARWKISGSTNWNWYSTNAPYTTGNRRDFSIVVSPKKAMNAVVYEANVGIVGAQGTSSSQRSTFTDLYNGPGSRAYDPVSNRFNLNYLTNLGVNWLWLEPIHPRGIVDSINSMYCVKNYFQVNALMSKANTRPAGMTEFQGFVAAADAAGVNVMMDVPFNHTAHDVELDNEGVVDFGGAGNPGNWQPTDLIPNRVPQFFSATNAWCSRASSSNDIAVAPDIDIAKWTDVSDVFYGDYAALVCANPQNDNNDLSADDWFDYSTNTGNFDRITQNVWRYRANSILYWLNQTGCTNGTPANLTSVGIDGLRADFADGLPPQCWEYIINKVRSQKWDFVFLAESLSWPPPSATTYRSGRDFDILCDSVYNGFQTASSAASYQSIFNSERSSYGQCLMLWNAASHDAGFYYTDPYQALIRFMVGGTIDGMPHIFYGQELGTTESFGFSAYSGDVPYVYGFNSLQPAITASIGNLRVDQLYLLYAAVGRARLSSPALQGTNRVFLSPTTSQPNIYAVAKFTSTNGSPNLNDVVFAFVNLDLANGHQGTFNVNLTQSGTNLFGIDPARMYNAKNIAAYLGADPNRQNYWLWGTNGVTGSNLLAAGVTVSLNPVPTNIAGWTNAPYEAQYFKLYDVTPPAVLAAPTTPGSYVLGNSVTFTWLPASDPEGGVSGYEVMVGTSPGASDVFNGIVEGTSLTVTNVYGATLYAEVSAINNAGIQGPSSASSAGVILVDPNWIPVLTMQGNNVLNWTSVSGKKYQVWSTTNLGTPFTTIGGVITATGPTTQTTNTLPDSTRFYRVQLFP
ncbi:MAG TPA: alpha-amylase family glycosyl hydrolase [Verrucomicrobiae bacterium]|jgi:glycosidase|nr:alpha-amylase family glycosyl hydrolase [Verrucomicrobiae bacterium]